MPFGTWAFSFPPLFRWGFMATGFSAAGHCWATADQALDAYYSAMQPLQTIVSETTTRFNFVSVFPSKTGSVWTLNSRYCSIVSTNVSCTPHPAISAPTNVIGSCTLTEPGSSLDPVESFVDGHILGWGVAIAMAAAWSIHALRRAI